MDVLVHLADHADRIVAKEDLIEKVWQGRFVTDDVLTVTIYALRKALGDDARKPRYVETVARRGYRLIAPMKEMAIAEPVQSRRYRWPAVAAAVVLTVFAAGASWVVRPARKHVQSPEAHEAYVKGRYFIDQRSIRAWRQALEQFERAIALDPRDPAAQAGLADTYTAMSDFGVASPAEMRPRAIAAARRALDLDPQSAEGLAALGRVQFLFDWDFAGAYRSLARAVARDADYMPAYQAIAWVESARGRHAEAIAAARRALQIDPVTMARYNELAWVLALSGHHAEARREIDRALQLDPQSFGSLLMKGWTYELTGQPDAAFATYREAMRLGGAPAQAIARAEAVYHAEGLAGYYRNWLDRPQTEGAAPMSDAWRAQLYVRAGELDRAIESLERAYEKREGALAWVNVEPAFDPLRPDARFQQIAARIHPSP